MNLTPRALRKSGGFGYAGNVKHSLVVEKAQMAAPDYQQLIIEGVKGLPPEALAEIADFIYFVRRRVSHPQTFAEEMRDALLNIELRQLSRDEEAHLEKEFDDYERLHPRE